MARIRWRPDASFEIVDARMSLRDIVVAAGERNLDWVVLERRDARRNPVIPDYYAFRLDELRGLPLSDDQWDAPAESTLDLHESEASPVYPQSTRPDAVQMGLMTVSQPSMIRALAVDVAGVPQVVGELRGWDGAPTGRAIDLFGTTFGLGPARGEGAEAPDLVAANGGDHAPVQLDAVLSARAPRELRVDEDALVEVRVELAEGATPFADAQPAQINSDEEIVAILQVRDLQLDVIGPRVLRLKPPRAGSPTQNAFVVMPRAPGRGEVLVMFRQGGSDLGTIPLGVSVSTGAVPADTVEGTTVANARDTADDDRLVLVIQEWPEGRNIRYHYFATCGLLQWDHMEFRSEFVRARSGRTGSAPLRYVKSIYKRVVRDGFASWEDRRAFQAVLRGIGVEMCRQLLVDDFVRDVWEQREGIDTIQIYSLEPYIPWELMRLWHPKEKRADERAFGEYNLIRTFTGEAAPAEIGGRDWRFLKATYPHASHPNVGSETDYFTITLPGAGIDARPVAPARNDLLDALANPDYDILHIVCHGASELDNIELSRLILSDEEAGGTVRDVTASTSDVAGSGVLRPRRPLVFLNACQSGQQAPSLTDMGGWPRTFWEIGAGAFVGTSWSVREQPAAAFARAFYDTLRAGETLAAAAAGAREAAAEFKDSSWLAYTVYGNPSARLRD
jgi:hypothetical protein